MVGLSNGASFVDQTVKKLDNFQDSILAIEIGSPFWQKKMDSENILHLNNRDNDSLSKGDVKILIPTLFKAFPKWFLAKIFGSGLSFSKAFDFNSARDIVFFADSISFCLLSTIIERKSFDILTVLLSVCDKSIQFF